MVNRAPRARTACPLASGGWRLRHEANQLARNDALGFAEHDRRLDVVELAVARALTLDAVEALCSCDRRIVAFFLQWRADVVTGHPFARRFRSAFARRWDRDARG
jgi:hypothetical protein